MVDLKKLRLEEITMEEYKSRQDWWGGGLEIINRNLYCKVVNPILFDIDSSTDKSRVKSYSKAIIDSICNTSICSVSVNNKGVWRRLHKYRGEYQIYDSIPKGSAEEGIQTKWKKMSEIDSEPQIEEMARIAEQDRYHYNFMEITTCFVGKAILRPRIEFVEYPMGKQIIGYEIGFWNKYKQVFSINIKNRRKYYEWYNGLWVPDGYKKLKSPASLRGR